MRPLAFMLILLAAPAFAGDAGYEVLDSQDAAVCDYFKVPRPAAPIKWEPLAESSDGLNFRAVFDFENSGKPVEVRRREDEMMAFQGTYYLVAPLGTTIPLNWFRAQVDAVKGFMGPPAPMKMYWQDDINVDAEIVQFNKKYYVRSVPVRDALNFVMILEARDGVLKQLCKYARPPTN